jgi:hypothetical protein
MISLTSEPEIIKDGEILKLKLNIQGQINNKMYKGSYFNITLKKNGGTLGSVNLYPLRYNGNPLEWEVNPNSYGSYGTFNATCFIQEGPNLTSTTFIVEPDCIIGKVNTCNNLTVIEQANKLKNINVKKKEYQVDFTGGCSIQKPGQNFNHININQINKIKVLEDSTVENNLVSTVKVQKIGKNVNGIK